MRAPIAATAAFLAFSTMVHPPLAYGQGQDKAQDKAQDTCAVPSLLLFSDATLKHVAAAAKDKAPITIAVVGTASSALSGPAGAVSSYPAKLEAALRRRLPGLSIKVVSDAKPRKTAVEMLQNMDKLLNDQHPTLVVWQTGTIDALRGLDPEEFRSAVDEGVEKLQTSGADVILMNMQYSPRTEVMISLAPYADNMRVVSRDREVPLFDRLAVMRQWSDSGVFDFSASSKDPAFAQSVHDCLGRALATMVIETAGLSGLETKATK